MKKIKLNLSKTKGRGERRKKKGRGCPKNQEEKRQNRHQKRNE
jgi:hypothetical protein